MSLMARDSYHRIVMRTNQLNVVSAQTRHAVCLAFIWSRVGIALQLWLVMALVLGRGATGFGQETNLVPIQARVMHFSQQQRREMIQAHLAAPRMSAPRVAPRTTGGSLSLLSHVPYVPAERNQGGCGDCWQWAGTGVMEVAHDVQDGIFTRLSVQFINSCETQIPCCEGGWLEDFASFYSGTDRFAIPWTNAYAQFTSGSESCTSSPCADMSSASRFPIQSISAVTLDTWGVGQSQAIANIKNALNQSKAVWFAFWLPNTNGWPSFHDFWLNQPETAVWTNFYYGHCATDDAGHVVLCVGYNDEDPTNPYWIMLNSWGTLV